MGAILAVHGAALSSVLAVIKSLEFSRDRVRFRVKLVPVIQLPLGLDSGMPVLSVGNATANGCRVREVELVMERTVTEREGARRMSHYCLIPGTGIIPGFGELRVDLCKALEAVVHGLWKGPGTTYYPDIRMWALVRYVANFKTYKAKSRVYQAKWCGAIDKPPDGIQWLKVVEDEEVPEP
jgi:hypothetical protein